METVHSVESAEGWIRVGFGVQGGLLFCEVKMYCLQGLESGG